MAICIAKRKPRVEYSQVFNPWLSMMIQYCIVIRMFLEAALFGQVV